MNLKLRLQLSAMMFLEYFIKGAWFVTLGTYLLKNLQADGLELAQVFSTQSLGAVAAPFFIGFIADRYFNAERVLAVLHLLGACLLTGMYLADSVSSFYPYVLAYFIAYMSSLALANSIAFRHIQDTKRYFPGIRVWGTVGWITAGSAISLVFHWDNAASVDAGALRNTFLLASVCSLLLATLSFLLPKTPPLLRKGDTRFTVAKALGLEALVLLKNRGFLVFFVTAIVICIPMSFYYQNANPYLVHVGLSNPTAKMALGQLSEALCLLAIPFLFAKLGYKRMILVGIAAWTIRYLLFAYGNHPDLAAMLIVAIILHGVCYDFMFVVGQIYTDTIAGAKYRSSAQGLVTVAMYGIGMLLGFWAAGGTSDYLEVHFSDNDYWKFLWITPAAMAFCCLLLFAFFFREQKTATEDRH